MSSLDSNLKSFNNISAKSKTSCGASPLPQNAINNNDSKEKEPNLTPWIVGGAVGVAIAAAYLYKRKVSKNEVNNVVNNIEEHGKTPVAQVKTPVSHGNKPATPVNKKNSVILDDDCIEPIKPSELKAKDKEYEEYLKISKQREKERVEKALVQSRNITADVKEKLTALKAEKPQEGEESAKKIQKVFRQYLTNKKDLKALDRRQFPPSIPVESIKSLLIDSAKCNIILNELMINKNDKSLESALKLSKKLGKNEIVSSFNPSHVKAILKEIDKNPEKYGFTSKKLAEFSKEACGCVNNSIKTINLEQVEAIYLKRVLFNNQSMKKAAKLKKMLEKAIKSKDPVNEAFSNIYFANTKSCRKFIAEAERESGVKLSHAGNLPWESSSLSNDEFNDFVNNVLKNKKNPDKLTKALKLSRQQEQIYKTPSGKEIKYKHIARGSFGHVVKVTVDEKSYALKVFYSENFNNGIYTEANAGLYLKNKKAGNAYSTFHYADFDNKFMLTEFVKKPAKNQYIPENWDEVIPVHSLSHYGVGLSSVGMKGYVLDDMNLGSIINGKIVDYGKNVPISDSDINLGIREIADDIQVFIPKTNVAVRS